MSYSIRVDESRCIGCGTCVRECARHLPVYKNGQGGSGGLDCTGCLHCFAVCPQGAVTVDGVEPVDDGHAGIDPAALRGLVARRRSYRHFEARPPEPQLLEELIRTAAYVPSGGNSHCHRLTVITTGEGRRRLEAELTRIYRKRKVLLGSSLVRAAFCMAADSQTRAFLRDRTYFTRVSYLLGQIAAGEDPIFYSPPVIVLIHSPRLIPTPREDSVLAAYSVVLAAETLGLDPREQIYAVVVVGRPVVRFHRAVPRKPVPVTWIR